MRNLPTEHPLPPRAPLRGALLTSGYVAPTRRLGHGQWLRRSRSGTILPHGSPSRCAVKGRRRRRRAPGGLPRRGAVRRSRSVRFEQGCTAVGAELVVRAQHVTTVGTVPVRQGRILPDLLPRTHSTGLDLEIAKEGRSVLEPRPLVVDLLLSPLDVPGGEGPALGALQRDTCQVLRAGGEDDLELLVGRKQP
jgi:hypothetical protein